MKRILIFLLAVILCSKTFSQDSKLLLGLELSPTMTWLRGNSRLGAVDLRFSYSAGLSAEYLVIPQISLKSGISYERKGSKFDLSMSDETGPLGTMDVYDNFDYLVLPILVSFSTKSKVKNYFDAGPYIGYLMSHKTIMSSYGDIPEATINNYSNTEKIDFGLSIGCGFSVPIGDNLLCDLGMKGNLGLIKTNKKDKSDNVLSKANSIGLLIGLKYKI
jgi:hypothetical protein